ncbi:HTH-type transcriptional regulator UlaR [Roseimaritima multifibrata]|uniref:HTH-type transcriptional regulator UlaR n=1 Tax=Roseimaritima multifibrata TaxID=1930274 RepID=A0A517MD52_9BACT|nr:DeoR/GlpR family DNA-binding transcription regulator [Roseimaritima multifibrata]QDS92811.1 HTH-type transcriptional regulator UlaR [Roseimaritima multifibrata]
MVSVNGNDLSRLETRRQELRRTLQAHGFVALGDLAERMGVSESTVRRDLDYLEEQGDAKRTHGGVFWTGSPTSMRLFETREDSHWQRKRVIAAAAAKLVSDHETILLDGGSTTYELARQLVGRPLQVVTNSLPVANLFAASEASDLVLIGGCVDHRTGVAIGPFANQMLGKLNVSQAFLSVAGIDPRGFYNSNLLLVETEQAMIASADRSIVVADSSKFGRASLSRLCGLGEVSCIVTDKKLAPEWAERLQTAGPQLVWGDESV